MRQATAVKILASGTNVFLTGAPGSGKTHLLNRFIRYLRSRDIPVAITAPTGIAATHIGGMTLHSWSGLGVREAVDEQTIDWLLEKKHIRTRFEKTKVLIIDEVSMLTPGLFEAVDAVLRNFRFSTEPFGGLQVVLTGDFFQLPPVGAARGQARFAWQTETWERLNPTVCYLSERHRHSDDVLVRLLDEIRRGSISNDSRAVLRNCFGRQITAVTRPTRLFTHNVDVDRINEQELDQLSGKVRKYSVVTKGRTQVAEKMLQNSLIAEKLRLKIGSLVIFIKNNFEKGFVNGTLGTVTGFDPESGYPYVTAADGAVFFAEPEEWSLEDERGKKLASIAQVPLRLAWAITVHKSQGMTLEAAEIDLSKAFEPGHGYVALSRVKSLAGLSLLGLNERALQVDVAVLQADEQMLQQSRIAEAQYHDAPLIEKYPPLTVDQVKEKRKIPTAAKTKDLLKTGHSIAEIALKRELKPGTIIAHLEQLVLDEELDFSVTHIFPDPGVCERILMAKKAVLHRNDPQEKTESGDVRLGSIFRELKEEVPYDDIKLALLREMVKSSDSD